MVFKANSPPSVLLVLLLVLINLVAVLQIDELLVDFQNLVLVYFYDVIKLIDLISAQFFNLLPFFLFVAVTIPGNSGDKEFHGNQRVRPRLM